MTTWHVAYWARQNDETVFGMARIVSARRPSWSACAAAVPGFVTGRLVLSEPAL